MAARRRSPPMALAAARDRSMPIWPAIASDLVRVGRIGPASAKSRSVSKPVKTGSCSSSTTRVPGLDRALALVGLDLVREAFAAGGLARAVAADQRQPVARADVEVEPSEQPAGRPGSGQGLSQG